MRKPPRRSAALLVSSIFALALAGGCAQEAPFEPTTDCAKLENCGQCASRGACAWCGDATKGQCLAIGHAECAAPSQWSKTPEVCAPPPATTAERVKPPAFAPESEEAATVERALRRAFPNANVTPSLVDAVMAVLPKKHASDKAPIVKHVREKDHKLYMGYADHHRVRSMSPASKGMESQFVMQLPMVRVTLPATLDADRRVIETEIGDVDLSRDHLLGSVDLVASKYGDAKHLGYRPARVDLITPARAAGSRFGAIAVYLGYRNKADRGPSFYLLEAGTATGDAKMIYYSPSMEKIASVTSYYLPTPFVTLANTYSGGITMAPAPNQDEPDTLVVNSHAVGEKDPYITVTVKYQRAKTMELALPQELTLNAGARVALIAETMGIKNAEELQKLLAKLGQDLYWKHHPHYVAPTASGAPAAPPPPR
jgi:hypothetical protein